MGRAYSIDLRKRVVAAVETGGLSCRQAAAQFDVGISTAILWVQRFRRTGSVEPDKIGGYKPRKIAGVHRDWLVRRCRRRAQWCKYRSRIDPARLVFIDETRTKTNMAPLRGWAPRGQRIKAHIPHGHWQTLTFLAALRHDRITAPWLIDGPINGESFRVYIESVLVPTLRTGDIVIMDNLGSHRSEAVRRAIRTAGARLFFLPKYSPDLNPIEQFFAKLKHWLRKAAQRSSDAVCDAIGHILKTVSATECLNYFESSGYDQM